MQKSVKGSVIWTFRAICNHADVNIISHDVHKKRKKFYLIKIIF